MNSHGDRTELVTNACANVPCNRTAGGWGGAITKPGQRLEHVLSSAAFDLAM